MKTKTTYAAVIALLLAPTFAFAGPGCGGDKVQTEASLSCADGTIYDEATKTCVTTTS